MSAYLFRYFPLVDRPRPVCMPLRERVAGLQHRAAVAAREADVLAATSVFNLAALLASDCADAQLARRWCHRLAALTLSRRPRSPQEATSALEPIVNLARLRTRAGDGSGAWALLETLHTAVTTRDDTTIDGLTIPVTQLTSTPEAHRQLQRWTWTVLLGSGAHALSSAGHWDQARQRLALLNGVTPRMLDGRQTTVIAHLLSEQRDAAAAVLDATHSGEPWEQAVTECLRLLHDPHCDERRQAAIAGYHALGSVAPGLAVFNVRLGLAMADALLLTGHQPPAPVWQEILDTASADGYAARDVLSHEAAVKAADEDRLQQLRALVDTCALGLGRLPSATRAAVEDALSTAADVIRGQDKATQQATSRP